MWPEPLDIDEYVAYYLDRLDGREAGNAFEYLVEAPKEAVPLLIDAYHREARASRRAEIVEIVWQFRDPATVQFLATALREPHRLQWRLSCLSLDSSTARTALSPCRVTFARTIGHPRYP